MYIWSNIQQICQNSFGWQDLLEEMIGFARNESSASISLQKMESKGIYVELGVKSCLSKVQKSKQISSSNVNASLFLQKFISLFPTD